MDDNIFVTNTFSVAARCEKTNAFGAIVTTSSPAVGARVIQCKSGTGVVLSQNMTDPRLASIGMSVLEKNLGAHSAVNAMKGATPYSEYRQFAVIDNEGIAETFTGEKAFGPYNGGFVSQNVAAIGNLLSDSNIPQAMGERYLSKNNTDFPDRLLEAIEAGYELGGEVREERSMALVIYTDTDFPYIDLRVDYSKNPLEEMRKLWEVWKDYADTYKQKALNPEES